MRRWLLVAIIFIVLLIAPLVWAGCPGCDLGLGIGGGLDDGPAPTVTPGGGMPSLNDAICFWNLDELAGVRVDAVGTGCVGGCDLTDNNTVLWAAGVSAETVNSAQLVRINSEYLSHVDAASLSMGDIDFTFIWWAYLDSKPAGGTLTIFSKWNTSAEYWLRYQQNIDRFQFIIANPGGQAVTANTFGSPALSTWHFIEVYYDSTANELGIRINNGVADTVNTSPGPVDLAMPFCIGAHGQPTHHWDGRDDAAGLWKRRLTPVEGTWLYNGGQGRQWPF